MNFAGRPDVPYLEMMGGIDCGNIQLVLRSALGAPSARHPVPEGFRRAAVLVPLTRGSDTCELLLTKRTQDVERHKGQISFPGGVMDSNDIDLPATALRETNEELGIPPDAVEPIGLLDDLTTPTGFVITPLVGMVDPSIVVIPNPLEVAEVVRLPLSFFASPRSGHCEIREVDGRHHEVWFYDDGSHVIWGATAAIIRSLLTKLNLA